MRRRPSRFLGRALGYGSRQPGASAAFYGVGNRRHGAEAGAQPPDFLELEAAAPGAAGLAFRFPLDWPLFLDWRLFLRFGRGRAYPLYQRAGSLHLAFAAAVAEDAVVAYLDEAGREDVQAEAAQELLAV